MRRLNGKTAVITGAASGIGRATALLFANEGANVVLADLNGPGGEAAAAAASAMGSRCVFQRADVSAEADVQALMQRALDEFGRLDVVFNNAGFGGALGPIEKVGLDDWNRTVGVLLGGVFLGIKHAVPPMRAQGGGVILSTASIVGIGGFPHSHSYGAAKAAVLNLTRSAAIQLAPDRIRVNSIAPGGISTPINGATQFDKSATDAWLSQVQPFPLAGQAEDIAEAALYLASDAARFVTGHCLVVDGGATAGVAVSQARVDDHLGGIQRSFVGPSFEA